MVDPLAPLQSTSLSGLRGWTAPEAVARLEAIAAALPGCGDPRVLEGLAAGLPGALRGLSPEVGLALAAVATALVSHGPVIATDVAELEPRLRIAWRRVALAAGDAALLDSLDDTELLRAVHGWSIDVVLDPRPLLRRLASARDPRLRKQALEWIIPAVAQLAATPAEAFEVILRFAAEDEDPTLRARALRMLGEGWLLRLPPARARDRVIAAVLEGSGGAGTTSLVVTRAGIATAAALGRRDWLLSLVGDPSRPGPARAEALDAMGPLAHAEDLDVALELARADPLPLLPAVRRFLLAAHRHGVFLRSHHVGVLLELYDAHPPWTGEEVFRVAFIVRTELIERLAALPADDPRWIRRASILSAAVGTRAHVLLRERLEEVQDPAVAHALVEAAGCSPEYEGEAPLLRWLDALPELVVPVLRVKGGPSAEAELLARVLDPRFPPTLRWLAIDVLWAHSRDRGALRRELAARLGPHDAGLLSKKYVEHRDHRVAQLVTDAPWPDEPRHAIEPLARFEVLCESGDIERLPQVVALLREILRGYVRRALAGDFTIKRLAQPELEQRLFRYGRHLVAEGRTVRRHLEAASETGRDLVLQVAVDWLREEPAPAVCVALLELIGRHSPGATVLRMIEPLWRHGDREVRRAAIETILAAGEGARGLELSLCRLAEHEEPRIMTQALAAIASFGARWAEPLVIAALQRPEMAVKKEAAHALATVGSEQAVAPLVDWLAHHDNAGLRNELSAALGHAAGPTRVAVLVDALEHETEPRRIELLWDALAGHLPLAAALRLARSSRASHRALLEACLDGRVPLADASAERLAAALHRSKLLPPTPFQDPGRRLRVEGFSPQAARELVDERSPGLEAAILVTIRAGLADWIAWLRSDDGADPRALALVLDAAQGSSHAEHVGALLELVERQRNTVDSGAVVGWLERCVAGQSVGLAIKVRAIERLRAMPPSAVAGGLRRHRLLGRLGAVRTRADLERCLEECRLGSGTAVALLLDVLQIPPSVRDEPPELTALREQVERWPTLDETARAHALTTLLAARPLDMPLVDPPPAPVEPKPAPGSIAELEALLATLQGGEAQDRNRAAAKLLDWPDAHAAWPRVLDAFLREDVALEPVFLNRLAQQLARWPNEPRARRRAEALVPHLAPWRLRVLAQAWAEGWLAGDLALGEPLRRAGEDLLLPLVWDAALRGDFRLIQLVRPSDSSAIQALVAFVRARSPADVEHIGDPERTPAVHDGDHADHTDLADPVAGREPEELLLLAETKGVAKGLAVRAVHALVEQGERSVAPLSRLCIDPRPPVRSAALRALRRVASREQTLEVTARVLAMETRRDVIVQLIKSLGHGRHEPSLPVLLEHLHHNDVQIRQGAHTAIRAWGREVVPELRRAARRARPDRRPAYAGLIAELEQIDA